MDVQWRNWSGEQQHTMLCSPGKMTRRGRARESGCGEGKSERGSGRVRHEVFPSHRRPFLGGATIVVEAITLLWRVLVCVSVCGQEASSKQTKANEKEDQKTTKEEAKLVVVLKLLLLEVVVLCMFVPRRGEVVVVVSVPSSHSLM